MPGREGKHTRARTLTISPLLSSRHPRRPPPRRRRHPQHRRHRLPGRPPRRHLPHVFRGRRGRGLPRRAPPVRDDQGSLGRRHRARPPGPARGRHRGRHPGHRRPGEAGHRPRVCGARRGAGLPLQPRHRALPQPGAGRPSGGADVHDRAHAHPGLAPVQDVAGRVDGRHGGRLPGRPVRAHPAGDGWRGGGPDSVAGQGGRGEEGGEEAGGAAPAS